MSWFRGLLFLFFGIFTFNDIYAYIITTYVGTGSCSSTGDGSTSLASATLSTPGDMTFDKAGNMYIAEFGGCRVRKITIATGIISTIAGGGSSSSDNIAATSYSLSNVGGVSVDSFGNVYVSSKWACKVFKVSTTGIITTYVGTGTCAGSQTDGIAATSTQIRHVEGNAVDSSGTLCTLCNIL